MQLLPEHVRRRVDAIWDRIWASGVSNPLTAIEYFSTVLLLRRLEDGFSSPLAGGGSGGAEAAPSWERLLALIDDEDIDSVSTLMQHVQIRFGIGASPDIASTTTWRDLGTLRSVMREVRDLDLTDRNHDILGDLFEYMLNHLSSAGHFGQFRTPRHLIRFLVEVVNPQPGETVVDPAGGTAGFLIAAHEHRRGTSTDPYIANEVDATIARVAQTNVLLHGMQGATIRVEDSLTYDVQDADVILANPPFAGAVIPERVSGYQSGTLKTELLFIELMMRRLKDGGRAGIVVPMGVLTSTSSAAVWVRRQLVENNRVSCIVELPGGVFRPYTGVKTGLIFWTNSAPGDQILLVRVSNDGYSLDDRREQIAADDLPAALRLIQGENADIPHAHVPISEIADQQFNLSPSRYIKHSSEAEWGAEVVSLREALSFARDAGDDLRDEIAHLEGLLR